MISFRPTKEAIELYKKVNDDELYKFANYNRIDSIIGFRIMEALGESKLLGIGLKHIIK